MNTHQMIEDLKKRFPLNNPASWRKVSTKQLKSWWNEYIKPTKEKQNEMKFEPTLFNPEGIKCTYVGGSLDGEKEYVLDSHVIRKINQRFEYYKWIGSREDTNQDESYNFIYQGIVECPIQ